MKGFVDAAPPEVREDLRKVAPYLEMFGLVNDDPDHARMRKFLYHGAMHINYNRLQEAVVVQKQPTTSSVQPRLFVQSLPEAGKVKDPLCFYDEKVDLQVED